MHCNSVLASTWHCSCFFKHLTRTKMLFRQQHFEAVSSASPRYFELRDMYSLVREFFAYYSE